MSLVVKKISVTAEGKEIVRNLSFEIQPGEMHVLMGPNGSGKSTLANTLAGHPKYEITKGDIILDGDSLKKLPPDERAKKGLFLSMQYTPEIPGVSISNFLRIAYDALHGTKSHPVQFHKALVEKAKTFGIDRDFLKRSVGVGLSGGEKKRVEMLQLAVLEPRYAILDETDSGLDVDGLKMVSSIINAYHTKDHGILLITHYDRFLNYLKPDYVHVLASGTIVKTGGLELAEHISREGYEAYAV